MRTDQATHDETGALRGSGAGPERVRNAEPGRDANRQRSERSSDSDPQRSAQDDLILHDDDEAELDLPR